MKHPIIARQPHKKEQLLYLFYSELAAHQTGYRIGTVPDGKTARKEVRYTTSTTDPKAPECAWPDKKLVWQGSDSDMKFMGEHKPWKRKIIPPGLASRPMPAL